MFVQPQTEPKSTRSELVKAIEVALSLDLPLPVLVVVLRTAIARAEVPG